MSGAVSLGRQTSASLSQDEDEETAAARGIRKLFRNVTRAFKHRGSSVTQVVGEVDNQKMSFGRLSAPAAEPYPYRQRRSLHLGSWARGPEFTRQSAATASDDPNLADNVLGAQGVSSAAGTDHV